MEYFNLHNCLLLSVSLIIIGIYGVLTRRSLILFFLSVEIMLNGVNISLIAFNFFLYSEHQFGHYLYMLSIGVAAVEAAVGLSMLIVLFKNTGKISADVISNLGDGK